MRFKLSNSKILYRDVSAETIRKLENLGFKFNTSEWDNGVMCLMIDESPIEIEINTLEKLIEFSREWGELVIADGRIEIYNDYRE